MQENQVCPSCCTPNMLKFYEVRSVPVNSCLLLSTRKQALNFPRGDIVLGFCEKCGFISNMAFKPSKVNYSSVYEDQQCFSATFDAFAHKLASELIKRHDLRNKHILEIGCGKGDFLTLLCEMGNNSGVGIDPAFVYDRAQNAASERLTFIRDYYSERYSKYQADLVCCRHTLEHIHNTAEFINTVRHAIGNRLDTTVFFEVPDVIRVLRELAFWDIYYEHCSYFSLGSLARLFRFCKFEITYLTKDFGDQYLLIEARPVNEVSPKVDDLEEDINAAAKCVKFFSEHYSGNLNQWKQRLQQMRKDKQKTVVWGSGSKCVAFLTTLGIKDEIEYVVDINPYRHGKFIPGAAKRIMPPNFLKKYQPDVTIVMNSMYCNEIRQMLNKMKVKTEVIQV
jgi:SAM-dependent methyltransferase